MVTTHDGANRGSEPPDELLWNIKTVILKTGLSRASVYRHMKRGLFPQRRRIGPNRVAWLAREILAWIEGCPRLDRRHDRANDTAGAAITKTLPESPPKVLG